MTDTKIVAIGGGTGLASLLRGLKHYTDHITAVVTVADDGGSSGRLREEYNILPPGDIRNCIVALADDEMMMTDVMQYRFKTGQLEGHSLGNLIITAMADLEGSFIGAVKSVSDFFAIRGKVLPVTNEDVRICAVMRDGTIIQGESSIPHFQLKNGNAIDHIELIPPDAQAFPDAVRAVLEADAVIIGPGSLYTSIIPNLLVGQIASALKSTQAKIIYISNIMTQPGETTGYNLEMHVRAINQHLQKNVIDLIIEDCTAIPEEILNRYRMEGAQTVETYSEYIDGTPILCGELADFSGKLGRHNPQRLAETICAVLKQGVIQKRVS